MFINRLPLRNTEPDGGGGAESFSRDYVQALREENKGWRLRAQEQEQRAAQAQAEAGARVAAAQQAANERILRAELKSLALAAGMLDAEGLKLADLGGVRLAEDGSVAGAEQMLAQLRESRPWLFGAAASSSTTHRPPKPGEPGPKDARTLSAQEYRAEKARLLGGGK